jgi:hypothetical protein
MPTALELVAPAMSVGKPAGSGCLPVRCGRQYPTQRRHRWSRIDQRKADLRAERPHLLSVQLAQCPKEIACRCPRPRRRCSRQRYERVQPFQPLAAPLVGRRHLGPWPAAARLACRNSTRDSAAGSYGGNGGSCFPSNRSRSCALPDLRWSAAGEASIYGFDDNAPGSSFYAVRSAVGGRSLRRSCGVLGISEVVETLRPCVRILAPGG